MLKALCTLTTISLLCACGGGGGGGGGSGGGGTSGSPATSTLSGTIALPETAAVDSDTNDAQQSNRQSNNSIGDAQVITTPVQLIGTVNVSGQGSGSGANFSAGDANDYFKTNLTQGQVIEMSFVGDTVANGADLFLVDDSTGMLVGSSQSASASKCLQVGRSGTYYIRIAATSGLALYTMHIGAPGDSSCSITTTSTDTIVSNELVAKLSPRSSVAARRAVMTAGGIELDDENHETGAEPPHERAHLLRLPGNDEVRARGLAKLARWGKSGRATSRLHAEQAFPPKFRRAQRAMETLEYAKRLMATGIYDYVEPNFKVEMFSTTASPYSSTDPLTIAQNWGYQQINQPAAMDRIIGLALPTSTQRPIVAVIDSGIVTDHPDLAAQIFDQYSFISSTSVALGDGDVPSANDPSQPANAPRWHGTHVAGTVAALDSNGRYGAGVAPNAWLMPLRVFAPGKSASSFDIVQAIRFASGLSNRSGRIPSRKADVINMSIGASGACPIQFSTEINNARARNVIVVAAAGNHDKGLTADVSSPANCGGVIAVGALDARKQQTYYSNTGAALRIMAPGGDSYQSTTGTGYTDAIYSTVASFQSTARVASFGPLSGTSMASPHVAGVMALMRYVHPSISPSDIDTLIANGQLSDDLGIPGRDDATGYGLIDARKAVDQAIYLATGGISPSGIVVASPASVSFGSLTTSVPIELKLTAASSEVVTNVVSNSAAVTVTAASVNNSTLLGTYTLNLNRNLVPLGTSFLKLTITTNLRTFSVQLTIVKNAPGASSTASYGGMFIGILDAATGAQRGLTYVQVANGKYVWSISGIPLGQVRIVAGTDLNSNRYFCDFGEVCGIFPDTADTISVNGDRGGLDFAVAPTGTTASSSLYTATSWTPLLLKHGFQTGTP